MRRSISLLLSMCCALSSSAQDDPQLKAFRERMDARLKAHPFFSKVKMETVYAAPFLFFIEKAPDDSPDYARAVINGYRPFLNVLVEQFETSYLKPLALPRSADAPAYAIAILNSAGRYLDFRTAINDPSLGYARAHYTPSLQLAVTYQDTFSRGNTKREEIQSLLHEFVHAMQHAYAKDGLMPKPVWFNEGLAEYRSACNHMASSLRDLPLQNNHVLMLAYGYLGAGRAYVSPIPDLVKATSYGEIVEQAKRRANGKVRGDLAVSMFYSQAEMFVRFLHEAKDQKYRKGFGQYMAAVQAGGAGVEVFEKALDCAKPEQMAALETEWLQWLDGVLRPQHPDMQSLVKGQAGGAAALTMAMEPPVAFDTKGLAWSPEDLAERLAGARRLCVLGLYETALAVLPPEGEQLEPAQQAFQKRERERITALKKLRETVLLDCDKTKPTLALGTVRGKFLRRDEANVVLQVGKAEQNVPLSAFGPTELLREGNRLKLFQGKDCWLEVWLLWLKGQSLGSLKDKLARGFTTLEDLKQDLTTDLDAASGRGAQVLAQLQNMPAVEDAAVARERLTELSSLVRDNAASPLLTKRKAGIELLARAYAERAFRADDLDALGITGTVRALGDGRITVTYPEPAKAPTADFTPVPEAERKWLGKQARLPYGGRSGLSPIAGGYQLVGSELLRWALPLSGPQVVELEFRFEENVFPEFLVVMSVTDGAGLFASPGGSVQVLDVHDEELDPSPLGGTTVIVGEPNKLRLDFDGQKVLTSSVNGKVSSTVDVGRLQGGELWLMVHTGTPVQISNLSITGKPDPRDPQAMRERFVARVLAELWR